MKKQLVLTAFLALAGAGPVAAAGRLDAPVVTAISQQEGIPFATLDYLFHEAAGTWDTDAAVLWSEYEVGLLTVEDLGDDMYELTWYREGGILIADILDGAGG